MSTWNDHFDMAVNYNSRLFVDKLVALSLCLPPEDPFLQVVNDTLEWAPSIVHPRIKFYLFQQTNKTFELLAVVAINKSDPGFDRIFFVANDLAIAMNPQRWYNLAHDALTRQPERLVVVERILEKLAEILDGYKLPTPAAFRNFIETVEIPDEELDLNDFITPPGSDDTDDLAF